MKFLLALIVAFFAIAFGELNPNDEFSNRLAKQPLLNDTVISCGAYQSDACNCVYYARDRQPSLPSGLSTCSDKKSKVNSNTAKAGCVLFRTGDPTYCHAAYVTSVSGGVVYYDQVSFSCLF
jgi:hypothetical protein